MNISSITTLVGEILEAAAASKSEMRTPFKALKKPVETVPVSPPSQPATEAVEPVDHPKLWTAVAEAPKAAAGPIPANRPVSLELNSSNIIQAVIFSELLVEPVCRRKRRWRSWS